MQLIRTFQRSIRRRMPACVGLLALFGLWAGSAASVSAQLPQLRLYSIFPPGGQAGSTVELQILNGTDLDEIDALHFSHPGLTAAPKMQGPEGGQTPVPNTFLITIADDVPLGVHEVRANGRFGISNPRSFVVGERPELIETEPNNSVEQATPVELNQTVNGRMNSGADIDFFKFTGQQGQRVIAFCRAARIDSQMAATLEFYDAFGRRLAYGRSLTRNEPLVDVTLPADGEYFVKVHDFTYGGGADYVYRLTLHTGPHIDYVMPPSGLANSKGQYTLYGRNLPGGEEAGVSIDGRPLQKMTVEIELPDDPTVLKLAENLDPVEAGVDGISYTLDTPQGRSNPVMIYFATAPVVMEQEPNDEPQQANKINVPAEFVGQFQSRGDVDYVEFEAKANEVYYIEAFAQRNGTTADPYVVLEQITRNDKGEETVKRLTALDDDNTNLAPNVFDTLSDDPVYRFAVPADGTYRISLRDRYFESRGDPSLVYRLSIRNEQPDYRLVAVPVGTAPNLETAAVSLRKGENVAVEVLAFRRDGFDETIDVTAEGLPDGVTVKGASIGPGQNRATLIFTSAEDAAQSFAEVRVVGRTRIEDKQKAAELAAARSALKPATEPLAKLSEDYQQAAETARTSSQQAAQAKESAAKIAEEAAKLAQAAAEAAKQAQEAEKTAVAAAEAAKQAEEAKAAQEKKIAEAEAAVMAAAQAYESSVQEINREARMGTVVWNGVQNQRPAASRVSRTLAVGVLNEPAPYQVTTDVFRVEANQNREVLVPVKVTKRAGFDNNVALTFEDVPKGVTAANKTINKGQDEELLLISVPNNAPLGTYTIYLKAAGQVSYSRNPEKAERAKAALTVAEKAEQEAAEAAKQAAQVRDAAKKNAEEAATAVNTATQAKEAAAKQSEEAQAAAKSAQEQAEAAKQSAAKDADNEQLAQEQMKAEKAAAEAAQAAQEAADKLSAADKALAEAQATAKEATEKAAQTEAGAKQAEEKAKAATAAKEAAKKASTDAENEAKPKNINVIAPSTPIVLTIKKAPATLTAAVPGGGNLKRGEKIDVKVAVKRVNDFAGPVTLTLPLPPNVTGLSAEPITIPADATDGVLTIQAAEDATEGDLANLVVRAVMEFEGDAAVDQSIKLKVTK
jgi:hypothetical protein